MVPSGFTWTSSSSCAGNSIHDQPDGPSVMTGAAGCGHTNSLWVCTSLAPRPLTDRDVPGRGQGRDRDARKPARLPPRPARSRHFQAVSVFALTPISAANSFVVRPLSPSRSTRFAHPRAYLVPSAPGVAPACSIVTNVVHRTRTSRSQRVRVAAATVNELGRHGVRIRAQIAPFVAPPGR